MINSFTQWFSDFLATFGHLGLAALMLAENLFLSIPSEVILPLAGFLVVRGELGFLPALLATTAGSLSGALILYAVSRYGARALVLRYGAWLRVGETDLDRAQDWFEKYGGRVVLFARMVPFARGIVSIPAGVLQMPLSRFVLLTAAGSAVWNAMLIGAGWYLGANWPRATRIVDSISDGVFAVALVTTIVSAVWWLRREAGVFGPLRDARIFRLLRSRRVVAYAEFSVVGAANAAIDFGTLNLLLWIWPAEDIVRFALYNTVALVLANANSYLLNTIWTFRRNTRHDLRETAMFVAQALLSVGVANGLLYVTAELLVAYTTLSGTFGQNLAKIISTAGASTLSFLILRHLVFKPRRKGDGRT